MVLYLWSFHQSSYNLVMNVEFCAPVHFMKKSYFYTEAGQDFLSLRPSAMYLKTSKQTKTTTKKAPSEIFLTILEI